MPVPPGSVPEKQASPRDIYLEILFKWRLAPELSLGNPVGWGRPGLGFPLPLLGLPWPAARTARPPPGSGPPDSPAQRNPAARPCARRPPPPPWAVPRVPGRCLGPGECRALSGPWGVPGAGCSLLGHSFPAPSSLPFPWPCGRLRQRPALGRGAGRRRGLPPAPSPQPARPGAGAN